MMTVKVIKFLILVALTNHVTCFRCDRRPYGSTTHASASDGRFKLVVNGADDTYIPEQLYIVQITETDNESSFTGFMISAEGEIKPDPKNPRRIVSLSPGELRPVNSLTAKFSDRCLNSVEHAMSSTKSSVEVYWQAPATANGCVTLRAMVAENEDVWFEDGAPLTQKLCEDLRQPDDVMPLVNYECEVCDEAKYEISFTGVWSRNTHTRLFPENDWIPRYSDLVGASHGAEYILWAPGSLATEGFKELAEHANTSKLEAEIREKIGDGVRTVIKGKGHGYRKMSNPTYAFFRTDNTNHLLSVAIALHPSPDWFLGVTRFELCQEDKTWLQKRELNLYPWDAGTDSGVSYESANSETFPQDAIGRVEMSSYNKNSPFYEMDMRDLNPFGTLHIKLIRTYHKECEVETSTVEVETSTTEETPTSTEEALTTTEGDNGETSDPEEALATSNGDNGEPSEPNDPSRYRNSVDADVGSGRRGSEAPIVTDPESSEDCPMSQWQEWSSCNGVCENGKVVGYQWRERYHLVDGKAVEKYDPNDTSTKKEVSTFCKNHYDTFEATRCEDVCEELDEDD